MIRNKRSGISLIELVVVLAILGLVLTTVFSILLFGQKSAKLSEETATNQFDVRQPMKATIELLRYASEVEILSSKPLTFDATFKYILFDSDSNDSLKYYTGGLTVSKPGFSSIEGLSFRVEKVEGNLKKLRITIGKAGDHQFDLETEILINNLSDSGIAGESSGSFIKFKNN